jgi:ATP-binding cassette, subfamily B, multidrug efflux pump
LYWGPWLLAFTIDVPSALVFVVAVPMLLAVVVGIMVRSVPLFTRVQGALDRLLQTTRENLTGVRVIRAFCREGDEVKEFDDRNETVTRRNLQVGHWSAVMTPATYLLVNLATVVLIRQGALRVQLGYLAQGDVVALYNYMAQMIIELVKLGSLVVTMNKSVACARRIRDILAIRSTMAYPRPDGTLQPVGVEAPAVVFRNVTFQYTDDGAPALSHIDFSASRESTVGIIGGTGSGKSTLVDLIPRFYDVTKGRVEVFGRDVREYPEGELLDHIALVPQKAMLFEGTIRDNLRWGNENATTRTCGRPWKWPRPKTWCWAGRTAGRPGGTGGPEPVRGPEQRLTIARALVKRPDILILDDSASALDFATDLHLRQAIKALEGERTVSSYPSAPAACGTRTPSWFWTTADWWDRAPTTSCCRAARGTRKSSTPSIRGERLKATNLERRWAEMAAKQESSLATLKKVWQIIDAYRHLLIESIVLAGLSVALQLYVPVLFGRGHRRHPGPGEGGLRPGGTHPLP